jgi:heptosyltransferase II
MMRYEDHRGLSPGSIERVAVLCLSGLGNTILFIPTLRRLREMLPQAQIDFICARRANYALMRECPWVRAILLEQRKFNAPIDNVKLLLKAASLRRNRYDVSIGVFPTNRIHYNILACAIGAKTRIDYSYPTQRWWHLPFLQDIRIPIDSSLHDVLQNSRTLRPLGCEEVSNLSLELWTPPEAAARARALRREIGAETPLISYHPVCFPDMTYKRWPPEHFANLIDLIAERVPQATHLLFGEGDDRSYLESLRAHCQSDRVHALCGEGLYVVAELLRESVLMISNDSGLMHVASAVGTPTAGLFGPTMDSRTRPWGVHAYAICSPDRRRPCRTYPFAPDRFPNCCRRYECMSEITPEGVMAFLEEHSLIPLS